MILNQKIIVKNYKCFDSKEGGGFDKILPINLIIGKNNSGKSSLIDLIEFLVNSNDNFTKTGRESKTPAIIIEHTLNESNISRVFPSGTSGGGIPGRSFYEYGKQFIGKKYTYQFNGKNQKTFVSTDAEYVRHAQKMFDSLASVVEFPFANKSFCNISAERDIIPETSNTELKFYSNGVGSTNTIQQILNKTDKDSTIIEKILLEELNVIINPDIHFSRILVQLDENNKWELFFEDANQKRISLSKMGSGIKTVLLVLLNLIVRPKIENKNPNSYVFAFEELENNLHPSLQRRLYNYIKKYSKKHAAYFFLTTHSNVVIDSFGTDKNAQLIHVSNDGDKSTSKTVLSYNGTKQILNDLGLKASDILQSNGIIWVEGPSDRNFINKWIEILSPELKEGLHYVIMFYGGRLLSNLSFDFEWLKKEVIPLLKINRNAYVVIDRDGKTINTKLNETKVRIKEEIGENRCWITKGREIENYLSDETLSNWLNENHKYKVEIVNNKNIKLEENIINSNNKIKLKYNLNKTIYSSEISEFINVDSISIMDLNEKLNELIEAIKEWNK
ncbi:AAA family ATPase [Lacinutrix mariniflava]|uniref:AAA family ATPase n=1 Tax=Lacinutrix mariniflava TaxID=342955 RepID=UPI0006E3F971|nr:AAA family ATPase [Lacinutrix mariniflava]